MRYAIGDVHGMYNTLLRLLAKIEEQDPKPQYIFVGDYIDRGPFSRQCVDLMVELFSKGHLGVRGNHDDVVDWILNGSCKTELKEMLRGPVSIPKVLYWWCQNGFTEMLKSYGFDAEEIYETEHTGEWQALLDRIRSFFPESHRKFFADLPLSWENDTHFVIHASLKPDIIIPRFGVESILNKYDRVHDALWSRVPGMLLSGGGYTEWGKIGIFGHTPTLHYGDDKPIAAGSIRLIDTGAVFGGSLSAYCLDTDSFLSVEVSVLDPH